jgi:hypothetical protein
MDACTRPVAPRPITLGCTLVQACPHHRTLWFHAARTSPAPPPQNPSTTFPFLGVPSGALETHVNLPTSQGRGIPSKWTPSILCHLQEVVPFSACHPVMCSVVGALTCGCRPSSPAHTHTHAHARTHKQALPPCTGPCACTRRHPRSPWHRYLPCTHHHNHVSLLLDFLYKWWGCGGVRLGL